MEKYYRLVDWLLHNLPMLEKRHNELMPGMSTSIVRAGGCRGWTGSKVERISIQRADLGLVLDRVKRALKGLSNKHKRVYQLRYREGLSYSMIAKEARCSEKTIERRIKDIRNAVALELQELSPGLIRKMLTNF